MRCNVNLAEADLNRYASQIRLKELGIEGQRRLKSSSVLVVGAGALGSAVLQYLAAAGVGLIGILDNDWVDETNLNRQVLYSAKDVNKPKPLAARDRLKLLNSEIVYKIHFIRLDRTIALKVIREYDIVVDCTDNFATRYVINDACTILNKPWVYGAILRFSGQVIVLNYNDGPTLRCIFPDQPHSIEIPTCNELGIIGTVAGMTGTIQANEVIKMITGSGEVLSGRMLTVDMLDFNMTTTSFERRPDAKLEEMGNYPDDDPGQEKVNEISSGMLRQMLAENPDIPVIDLRDPNDYSDIGFRTIKVLHYEVSDSMHLFSGKDQVVFHCRSGSRSASVINYLKKVHNAGFQMYSLII
ncbi:MAG TPA: HesA/MoeB/ThiF family protein [Bacteroidales bacterium]|jgi:adenylyltransferase/sulfurtransferase|nr:HesA/MoeB/ThiF family protein [Bacteroidales bacterium]